MIEQCGLGDTVEIKVEGQGLKILPLRPVRADWDEAFARMAKKDDDRLLIDDEVLNEWEREEWDF